MSQIPIGLVDEKGGARVTIALFCHSFHDEGDGIPALLARRSGRLFGAGESEICALRRSRGVIKDVLS